MPTTGETLAGIYDDWRNGRLDEFLATLAEDVEYTIHVPPSMIPVGGTVRGRAATADRFRSIVRDYEMLAFENGQFLINGEEGATRVRMRYIHRPTGQTLDTTAMHHWRLVNGRVALIEEFHDIGAVESFARRCGFCA